MKLIKYTLKPILVFMILSFTSHLQAKTFELPPGGHKVVGDVFTIKAKAGDTLYRIGQRYDLGIYEMIESNPRINPQHKIKSGTLVVIPDRFILPETPEGLYQGVFINLAELRLYYYPPGQNVVKTYPIGIGRRGWKTPVTPIGQPARITETVKNPTWKPTKSIQAAHFKTTGKYYPDVVEAGPNNPLGKFKIRTNLDNGRYLIHGTNDQSAVGRRVSSGCIRMWRADIKDLYDAIMMGKKSSLHDGDQLNDEGKLMPVSVWLARNQSPEVRIINSPYRVGVANGKVLLEAHMPLSDDEYHPQKDTSKAMAILRQQASKYRYNINWREALEVAKNQNGIPTPVGVVSRF